MIFDYLCPQIFPYKPQNINTKDFFSKDKPLIKNLCIYYPSSVIKKILFENKTLWFKNMYKFNDSREMVFINHKFQYVNDKLKKSKDIDKELIDMYNEVFDDICFKYNNEAKIIKGNKEFKCYSRYYALCTSYRRDNYTCWSAFTSVVKDKNNECNNSNIDDTRYGDCICFNKENLTMMIRESLKGLHYGFVCYDKEEQYNIISSFLKNLQKEYKELGIEKTRGYLNNYIEYCNVFFKDPFYDSEKEFRFVIDSHTYNLLNETKLDFDKYEFKFDLSLISHITISDETHLDSYHGKPEKFRVRRSKLILDESKDVKYDGILYEDYNTI